MVSLSSHQMMNNLVISHLAIINNAAVNICVQVFLCTHILLFNENQTNEADENNSINISKIKWILGSIIFFKKVPGLKY